jgi:heme-degrading monooxygenase HmoA
MPIVVIMESKGDPERLLEASKELGRRAGTADGLLARVLAPTEDGVVLIHVWKSAEARSAWHENPDHRQAVVASGMPALTTERHVREYVTDHVELFLPTRGDGSG